MSAYFFVEMFLIVLEFAFPAEETMMKILHINCLHL